MKLKVEEIKAAVNIVDVISTYTPLRRAGKELVGICVFHSDTTPSLYVNEDKQVFLCRACSVGGDILDFISQIENLSFQESVVELARIGGIEVEHGTVDKKPLEIIDANKRAMELYRRDVPLDWIKSRGYTKAFADEWKSGYAPKSGQFLFKIAKQEGWLDAAIMAGLVKRDKKGDHYDFFRDRYMFPIVSSKRLVAFGGRRAGMARAKFLNSSESAVYSKSKILYGLDSARQAAGKKKEMVVSEGYMDLWACRRAGIINSVATTGVAFTAQHATIVSRMVDGVVLCYDGDQAGEKATMLALGVCFNAGLPVRIARPPEGSDPDDMDPKELKKLIKKAPDAIEYYHDKYGHLPVRHQKRLIDTLAGYIHECPSRTLHDISKQQIKTFFKVDIVDAPAKPNSDVVGLAQRGVYAVMQDYANADKLFKGLERDHVKGDPALLYLYDAWKDNIESSSWVSRAPEKIRKQLISAINQLKFSQKSIQRLHILILDEALNKAMADIEERIGIA